MEESWMAPPLADVDAETDAPPLRRLGEEECAGDDGTRLPSRPGGNAVPALSLATGLWRMSRPLEDSHRGCSFMVPAGKRGLSLSRRATPWNTSPE
mmetsp:Transcript_3038/g.5512  ORF Transcript_3038/g.5512 Transcript_3038/m.5512 type:complete len:96 (-) Transcript_3038:1037-1324(-)